MNDYIEVPEDELNNLVEEVDKYRELILPNQDTIIDKVIRLSENNKSPNHVNYREFLDFFNYTLEKAEKIFGESEAWELIESLHSLALCYGLKYIETIRLRKDKNLIENDMNDMNDEIYPNRFDTSQSLSIPIRHDKPFIPSPIEPRFDQFYNNP